MSKKAFEKWLDKQNRIDTFCGLALLFVIFSGWFTTGLLTGYILWGL
jgi:hypothetical protein